MHDLTSFSVADMLEVGAELRRCCTKAVSLEEVAQRIVNFLYHDLRDHHGARAAALVRFFFTRPFASIPAQYQKFAHPVDDRPPSGSTRCLIVLAGAGLEPEWNFPTASPRASVPAHDRRIGLPMPMVAKLMRQFGLDAGLDAQPDSQFVLDQRGRATVFHVLDAKANDHLPADFVAHYGIRSLLGFGGAARSG